MFLDSYLSFKHLIDRGGCHAWSRVCWLYLEHLVPLPILDIIICPFLDYYILSIFHNLGSPLSFHTFIFDLMSSRKMYLYNAYIYTYILFKITFSLFAKKMVCINGKMMVKNTSAKFHGYFDKQFYVIRRYQSILWYLWAMKNHKTVIEFSSILML